MPADITPVALAGFFISQAILWLALGAFLVLVFWPRRRGGARRGGYGPPRRVETAHPWDRPARPHSGPDPDNIPSCSVIERDMEVRPLDFADRLKAANAKALQEADRAS